METWVCTVCICPTKRALVLYTLKATLYVLFDCIDQEIIHTNNRLKYVLTFITGKILDLSCLSRKLSLSFHQQGLQLSCRLLILFLQCTCIFCGDVKHFKTAHLRNMALYYCQHDLQYTILKSLIYNLSFSNANHLLYKIITLSKENHI